MTNCRNKYEFCFHSVGHGFFYTGKIDKLWFIYDCGSNSLNSIKIKIRNFCKTHLKSNRVLFLFLSHLHFDHVSGLNTLLSKIQVDYIFLPYLSPWERLLLALQASSTIPTWYIKFLIDPVEYLESLIKKAKNSQEKGKIKTKIILVVNISNGKGKKENIDSAKFNYSDNITIEFNGLKILDKNEASNLFQEEDNPDLKNYSYDKEKNLIVAEPLSNPNKVGELWEFILYTIPMPEGTLNCFRKKIIELLKDDQFFEKDINGRDILKIMRDKTKFKRLKESYSQLINSDKKLNMTSLVLWHSPIGLKHIKASLKFGYCDNYNNNEDCCKGKLKMDLCFRDPGCLQISAVAAAFMNNFAECGQLLTGDLNLENEDVYKDFKNFFVDKLDSTFLCSLPHHGSRNNWNDKLIKDIKPGPLWIVSAGNNKSFNYPPHGEVLMDIIQNGKMLFSTSADKDFVVSFY